MSVFLVLLLVAVIAAQKDRIADLSEYILTFITLN